MKTFNVTVTKEVPNLFMVGDSLTIETTPHKEKHLLVNAFRCVYIDGVFIKQLGYGEVIKTFLDYYKQVFKKVVTIEDLEIRTTKPTYAKAGTYNGFLITTEDGRTYSDAILEHVLGYNYSLDELFKKN